MFEFGPRETKGIVPGMSPRQTVSAGVTVAAAFAALRLLPGGTNLLAAAVVGGLGFFVTLWPINGRPLVEWSDIAIRYLLARVTGRTAFYSQAPTMGHRQSLDVDDFAIEAPIDLPGEIAGIEILEHPAPGGGHAGVAYDSESGAYTATLAVTSTDFALLDEGDQLRKLQGWSAVLAGFAREHSPVSRIQWVERTLPANADAMLDYFAANRDPDLALDSKHVRSYLALQDRAAAVQQEHELLVTLRIETHARRVRRDAKRLGKGQEGFCVLLMREINALTRALQDAGVEVHGVLTPRALGLRLREGSNPFANLGRRDRGVDQTQIGPMQSEAHWTHYEVDGTLNATYWITQWPRVGVGATFLSPLILNTTCTRAVGLTCEPVAPLKATRRAEAASTAMEGDEDARRRKGYRVGSRMRRQQRAITTREEELANGHAEILFAGFITVSAHSADELEAACAEVEQAAGQSRLELQRLDGEHDAAITYTMPLGRGLQAGLF